MEHNNRKEHKKRFSLRKRHFGQVLQQLMKNQKEHNDCVYDEYLCDEVDLAQREISAQRSRILIVKKTRELEKRDRLM